MYLLRSLSSQENVRKTNMANKYTITLSEMQRHNIVESIGAFLSDDRTNPRVGYYLPDGSEAPPMISDKKRADWPAVASLFDMFVALPEKALNQPEIVFDFTQEA